MRSSYVIPLSDVRTSSHAGAKGDNLRLLQRWGYPVPETYVIVWDAYQDYLAGDSSALDRVLAELHDVMGQSGGPHAIRSSANIEDSMESSLAGQFKTVLNVRSGEELRDAIKSVWESANSPSALKHLQHLGISNQNTRMAVLVQEMVPSGISGVSFGKNPVNGLDETIVEAVEGPGEKLVQDGVTPLRWVSKWGAWKTLPKESAIDLGLVEEVVRGTKAIQKRFGRPVDIEWAFGGGQLAYLQLREITSLKNLSVYSNRISKEFLPGMIKPLVWSVNIPLVNGAWIRFMAEAVGDLGLDPHEMSKSFHYRAYFSMSAMAKFFERLGLPDEMLEVLQGIESVGPERPSFRMTPELIALMPKLSLFAIDKACFGWRIRRKVPELRARYAEFLRKDFTSMQEAELLASYEELFKLNSEAAYHNIVTMLLLYFYSWLLKSRASKYDIDLESFDIAADVSELAEYDPTNSLRSLGEKYRTLSREERNAVDRSSELETATSEDLRVFREAVACFLAKFGHLSDSGNDFSTPPWRENPSVVLAMIRGFGSQEARARKGPSAEFLRLVRESASFNFAYKMARSYRVNREKVGSLYTYGYGLFRTVFTQIGKHLVARGLLDSPEDIFYLDLVQVKSCAASNHVSFDCKSTVVRIKLEMEASKNLVFPSTIFGDRPPPLPVASNREWRGVPTSRGYYSGKAKVVRSIEDMPKLVKGDVLIMPYSDVGMTPLFSKAGAVVSESGGLLSHSSIIAREYGIPAVVSVPDACSIPDNTRLSVDGFEGVVRAEI
jgi:pyruvate,water dikinase